MNLTTSPCVDHGRTVAFSHGDVPGHRRRVDIEDKTFGNVCPTYALRCILTFMEATGDMNWVRVWTCKCKHLM